MSATGIEIFLEVLFRSGVRTIFGNPGTTELPLNDSLAHDHRFHYFLTLHEIPAMAMADGFAMASGSLGVVNVHICCGVGNAMGMLYNAHIAGTPLLLTAGQQDRRLLLSEPVLAGDMLGVVRPWVKWACDVQRVQDVPAAVRRAIQTAMTPPTGPVFLSLPLDLQTEAMDRADCRAPALPDRRMKPGLEPIGRAAAILSSARNPVILAGSRVTESGACADLAALAECLGASVYSECNTSHGRLPIAADHPLYRRALPLWAPEVRAWLSEHDAILVVGMNFLREYIWREPNEPVPPNAILMHLDNHPGEIGKNYAMDVALLGDIREGLREIHTAVAGRLTADRLAEIRMKGDQAQTRKRQEIRQTWEQVRSERSRRPMTASTLMACIAETAPSDLAFVEEATTTNQHLLERLGILKDPYALFAHRGWALGWGMGCALGVKVAWPERPVLGLIGDGAAMYGIQALWTAARYCIPVTFVIANNGQYKILKVCGDILPLPEMAKRNYVGMDLAEPSIDFVGLARSLGVEAERIAEPETLTQALRDSYQRGRPMLIDVPLERT